jgi:hypothetical protein
MHHIKEKGRPCKWEQQHAAFGGPLFEKSGAKTFY